MSMHPTGECALQSQFVPDESVTAPSWDHQRPFALQVPGSIPGVLAKMAAEMWGMTRCTSANQGSH